MNNRTCGECQWYDYHHLLCVVGGDVVPTDCACDSFIPIKPTNGDKIRQMSNEELVMLLTDEGCKHCVYRVANSKGFTVTCRYSDKTRIPDCNAGTLAWLNAPAESEGKDE
jgi:hypothetical protein